MDYNRESILLEVSNLGQFVDRYMACGYNDDDTVEELLKRVTTVKKITGCELCGTWQLRSSLRKR